MYIYICTYIYIYVLYSLSFVCSLVEMRRTQIFWRIVIVFLSKSIMRCGKMLLAKMLLRCF